MSVETSTEETRLEGRIEQLASFLSSCRYDFEAIEKGPLYRTPSQVIQDRACLCLDGALFAAEFLMPENHFVTGRSGVLFLQYIGGSSDLRSHAVYVFSDGKQFGALGKSRHATLTHRAVNYHSLREVEESYINALEELSTLDYVSTAFVDLPDVGLCRKKEWEWRQRLREFCLEIEYKEWK